MLGALCLAAQASSPLVPKPCDQVPPSLLQLLVPNDFQPQKKEMACCSAAFTSYRLVTDRLSTLKTGVCLLNHRRRKWPTRPPRWPARWAHFACGAASATARMMARGCEDDGKGL